jgi:tRNA (guanosine-2'-O-)-methyltransferase
MTQDKKIEKSGLRKRADNAKKFRCKNLIVVLENPKTIENIGSALRNIDALGAEKLYVVDGYKLLPDDWQTMRDRKTLKAISASAIKWTYVHRFNSTQECLNYLDKNKFSSVVTSPHTKGKLNFEVSDADYTKYKRLAIWFGTESTGITEEAVSKSEFCINIQMAGIIESLNLGTSTGIVLYAATKQRRNFKKKKLVKKI